MSIFDDFTTDVAAPGPPAGWTYVEGADGVFTSAGHLLWSASLRAIEKNGGHDASLDRRQQLDQRSNQQRVP
jgi:hypothetical protein